MQPRAKHTNTLWPLRLSSNTGNNEKLHHSITTVYLCVPTGTVPDKENWRHRGWQMAMTDPLRGSLRQQVQQWDQETRTPWFCYLANDNSSSIIIYQKKQLELPQNWQSWHDCVELSSSTPKPTKFEHWQRLGSTLLSSLRWVFLVTTCTRCKHQDAICKVAFPGSPSQRLISYQANRSTQCPLILLFHPWEMVLLWKNFTWGSKCYSDRL